MSNLFRKVKLSVNFQKPNTWLMVTIFLLVVYLILKSLFDPKTVDLAFLKEELKNNPKIILKLEEVTTYSKNYLFESNGKTYRMLIWFKDTEDFETDMEILKLSYPKTPISYVEYLGMVKYYPIVGYLTLLSFIGSLFRYYQSNKIEKGNFLVRQFNVKFSDIAGIESTRKELENLVKYFSNPDIIKDMGGSVLKGGILYGPPGTGKTLMAKAVASEAGANFIAVSGSEFVELYVGMGAKRVRDMFSNARLNKPCVIFIDELDAFAKKRGSHNSHSELEQTVNQMLTEMDGMKNNDGILVLAATNRLEDLDDAIVRSGRFDMKIKVDLPTSSGRKEILDLYIKPNSRMKDIDTDQLAKLTRGFSGADLKNLVDQSIYVAAQREMNQGVITMQDFMEAKDKMLMGVVRDLNLSDEEKKLTSYHEVGHALCAKFTNNTEVSKISILPRSMSLGETQTNEEDKYSYSDKYIKDKIIMLLGGRVAEKMMFNHQSSGAENDLAKATSLARHYVCSFGMTDTFGPINFKFGSQEYNQLSEKTKSNIDEAVMNLLKDCEKETYQLLEKNKELLIKISEHLLEVESMESAQFEQLIAQHNEGLPHD